MLRENCDRHQELVNSIKDIECRIRTIEALQLAYNEKFITLFNNSETMLSDFKEFSKFIKAGLGSFIFMLLGFLIWYIQKL